MSRPIRIKRMLANPADKAAQAARFSSAAIVAVAFIYYGVLGAVSRVLPLGAGLLLVVLTVGLALAISRGSWWARTLLTVITTIQGFTLFAPSDPRAVWLPLTLRAGYVIAMAFSLRGLYREPAAALFRRRDTFVPSAPLRRAGERAVLIASGASFATSLVLTMAAADRLAKQYAVRPDFGTNGLNWLVVGVLPIGMLLLLYLPLALFVFVPRLPQHSIGRRLDLVRNISAILLPEVVLAGFMAISGGTADRIGSVVLLGPPIAATAGASYWYLKRWQSEASSSSHSLVAER